MRVLLVSANTQQAPYPVYPLGLDYVAGALGAAHPSRIVDLASCGSDALPALEAAMDDFRPQAVGLALRNIDSTDASDMWSCLDHYRQVANALRRTFTGPLILGGSGFTLFPVALMRALKADYGVLGEGERLVALLDALEQGGETGSLPGVVTAGDPAPSFPPPWNGPLVRRIGAGPHLPHYLKTGGMLNLQTQRGCTGRCIYCTYPLLEGRSLRPALPAVVADTALRLQAAGARYLYLTDALFNADPRHCLTVAQAFEAAGLHLPWGAFFSPTRPPAGFFRQLAAAGLTHVEFGSESFCDSVLTSYRKPFSAAEIEEAHASAREAGLHIAHYLILGGPGETAETLDRTLSRVDKLCRTVIFLFLGMRIYPRTALYERAVAEGQLSGEESLLQPVYYRSPAIGLEQVAARVQKAACGRANWIVGSGGAEVAATLSRLYDHGLHGPLWEHLIR